MPYAFLIVTLIGAAAVAFAYRPIRREPFTVVSFTCAWIAGELAFQNIVWQMVATAIFISFGALESWAGWLGLAVAVADWVGLLGLGIAGRRAAGVTAAALAEVRSGAFPIPDEPTAPTWGRWWRVTRAIPIKSRAVQVPPTSTTGATESRATASTSTVPASHRPRGPRSWCTSTGGPGSSVTSASRASR